jgi:hypothetical protein
VKYVTNQIGDVSLPVHGCSTFAVNRTTMEDWNVAKARLKEKFSKLIGDDLQAMEDKQSELVLRLEKRLGKTRAAILKLISEL